MKFSLSVVPPYHRKWREFRAWLSREEGSESPDSGACRSRIGCNTSKLSFYQTGKLHSCRALVTLCILVDEYWRPRTGSHWGFTDR